MNGYLQQTAAEPLFPKVLWNRPISRGSAGTLMVIGGHSKEFGETQSAYQYAVAAGVGKCRVILPDALRNLLQGFDDTWFVASSPSGSIGRGAIADIDHNLQSADGVLIGPNLSNNSETAVVTEKLVGETTVPIAVTTDAVDSLVFHATAMTDCDKCLLVVDMPQIFKLASALGIALKVKADRGLLGRVEIVQQLAELSKASIICYGSEIIVACQGKTSATTTLERVPAVVVAAVSAVFWQQRQGDSFERLTTAAYVCAAASAQNEDNVSVQALAKSIEKVVDAY